MIKKAKDLKVGDGFLCAGNACVVMKPVEEQSSMRNHVSINYCLMNKITSYAWLVVPDDTTFEVERSDICI